MRNVWFREIEKERERRIYVYLLKFVEKERHLDSNDLDESSHSHSQYKSVVSRQTLSRADDEGKKEGRRTL